MVDLCYRTILLSQLPRDKMLGKYKNSRKEEAISEIHGKQTTMTTLLKPGSRGVSWKSYFWLYIASLGPHQEQNWALGSVTSLLPKCVSLACNWGHVGGQGTSVGWEEGHGHPRRLRVVCSWKPRDAELRHQGTLCQPGPFVVTKIKNCINSWALLKTDPLCF